MNFQQNWLKVLECVETLINWYIWLFATSFQLFCEIKCDIFEKKSINNHFKQPWRGEDSVKYRNRKKHCF